MLDSSSDEGDLDGEEPELADQQQGAALPPFFAAIPSLSAAAAATSLQQPAAPAAEQPPKPQRPPSQQHAAPPAAPAAAAGERPLSASAFKRQREELTQQLFTEFNRTVFEGRLPRDLEMRWNARLLTTAGLTHYRRDIPDDPYAPPV